MNSDGGHRSLRFGYFDLDLDSGELRRRGVRLHLQGKPFEVLVLLLERPGELVARELLRQKLWPDGTHVDFEHGVNTAVNKLREALGDDAASPRFIETIPRRGYRFGCPVEAIPRPEAWAGQNPATQKAAGAGRARQVRATGIAAGLLLVAVVAGVFRAARRSERFDSVAVLPFANATGDASLDYLGDGLAESVLNDLARLGGLRVVARTTAFRYRGAGADPVRAGRALGVAVVLTGSVRSSADGLELQAELVNVHDGSQLWGERFALERASAADLERRVSREISERLRVRLSQDERRRLERPRGASAEAWPLYLEARYALNKRTGAELRKALLLFLHALDRDPNSSLAWTGVSDAYSLLSYYGEEPPREVRPKAKAAAERALSIDPELGEAHASLAGVLGNYDWNFAEAERENRTAIRLSPGYATAHHWYGLFLICDGRLAEAEKEIRTAASLDPLSAGIEATLGGIIEREGRRQEAVALYRRILDFAPESGNARYLLARSLLLEGHHEEALAEFRRTFPDSPAGTASPHDLIHALGVSGRREEAETRLRHLLEERSHRYRPASGVALAYLGLGDKDAALAWLETAFEERDLGLLYTRIEPRFAPLWEHRRWVALMRRVGLSPVPVSVAPAWTSPGVKP